jgi:hypothetical protein
MGLVARDIPLSGKSWLLFVGILRKNDGFFNGVGVSKPFEFAIAEVVYLDCEYFIIRRSRFGDEAINAVLL